MSGNDLSKNNRPTGNAEPRVTSPRPLEGSVGGLAQRETLEGLIDDARSHGEDETRRRQLARCVRGARLDLSAGSSDSGGGCGPGAPRSKLLREATDDPPAIIQIEPVDISGRSRSRHRQRNPIRLDEMASLSPEIDEIVDDEIRFDLDDLDEDDLIVL
ncbi:MAG: hypothetical protein R2849_14415 [Thermomicrobiales bacterium]